LQRIAAGADDEKDATREIAPELVEDYRVRAIL
jgi:hypothetical protein